MTSSLSSPSPTEPPSEEPSSIELRKADHPHLSLYVGPPESPSLDPKKSGLAAYEFKFLLDEAQAREVENRLAAHMTLDPNADANGNYHISTLYCDTPNLDVYHRRGRHRLSKFRIRRYGESTRIYLELKSKKKQEVRKRRTSIDLDRLDDLVQDRPGASLGAMSYGRQLRRAGAVPVVLIEYDRVAYFAPGANGTLRLTFDRQIRGGATQGWSLNRPSETSQVLSDRVVCEFKFRGAMPSLFKTVVQVMNLAPCGVSKYRLCIAALALGKISDTESSSHA